MSDCYLGDRCRGPKYHVCLKGKPDTFPKLLGNINRQEAKKVGQGMKGRKMTMEARTLISEAQRKRWALIRAERERLSA